VSGALIRQGIDAYFATTRVTLDYLCGIHEDFYERFALLAIHAKGQHCFIGPSFSRLQLQMASLHDIRLWEDGQDPLQFLKQLAEEWGLRTAVIAVDDKMPASLLLEMQKILPAVLFRSGAPVLSKLRSIKDEQELEHLKHAASIGDKTFESVVPLIREGMTEAELQDLIYAHMRKQGGEPAFGIIATGAHGAEPHHRSNSTPLKRGDVLVLDYGCTYQGYHGDMTRTLSVGPASDEVKEAYRIVFEAHHRARETIRPGISCEEVDRAAREHIASKGYGEFFIHRTGHGIGLELHEDPYIVKGNSKPLEVGQCFSIEPGIYIPGEFGIRIENIVRVTPEGHESLNEEPPLEILEL
jgi:Xaa-Pro aminopeptidase